MNLAHNCAANGHRQAERFQVVRREHPAHVVQIKPTGLAIRGTWDGESLVVRLSARAPEASRVF